ncbi:hypothetical protein FRB90_012590 [Tulasnella sp. 427]|nr:hypothetical protein FRB90_012590 [Tulasnella sp. 427]
MKKSPRKSSAKAPKGKRKRATSEEEEELSSDGNDDESDAYEEGSKDETESDVESLHSDDLDDDKPAAKKRKRTASQSSPRKKATPRGRRVAKAADDDDFDDEVESGVEIVGKVVQAPTTGRVPPGRISQNTLDLLKQLTNPKYNDREWFKLHEPVYRLAEKVTGLVLTKVEWVDFVNKLVEKVTEDVDEEIPPLPAKDVIHRIYRDVRFSNDKTPYKTNFSASFSRSGRKGIFAHYHVSIASGGRSFAAAVAEIIYPVPSSSVFRSHILRDSTPLRNVLSDKAFVKFFGQPKKHPKGERQSVFGHEDELKVAPKGVDKNHKDIDLLKVRSPAVIHRFLDSEVLDPDFMDKLCSVMRIMQPFVHLLNEMATVPPDDPSEDEE